MRFLLFVLIVLVLACTAQAYMTEKDYQSEFVRFVQRFGKQYEADELFARYATFKQNIDIINAHNAVPSHTSKQGVHYYSDLTGAEMKEKLNGYRARTNKNFETGFKAPAALPTTVDWVTKGAVTAVKDQGQCGSCWSFSTTGSVEGAHFLATGSLVSLSEQQLMDCSGSFGNEGCDGGEMDAAFQYIIANKGICSESEYPYKAVDGTCQTTCKIQATISNYADVIPSNETDLLVHAAVQPISVAIEADQDVFQNYQSGVISGTSCGTNLDHGVLVVGYGNDATTGLDYWLVKNSWGATWGLNGYVKIARNANVCGIALDPSYPIA